MVCIPRQSRDIQTRYAFGSICFCIPRQRRDMSKAKGIYLISNWRVATIYRVRAKREHIEWAKPTYRQKEKQEQTRTFSVGFSLEL